MEPEVNIMVNPAITFVVMTFSYLLLGHWVEFFFGASQRDIYLVAYPSLRVDVEQITCEGARSFPPSRLGPLSIQTSHLNVHRHFSSFGTTERAHLPKLAPQFAIGAFQQRGGAHHFAHYSLQCIVADRLLKLTLKGGDGLRLCWPPLRGKGREPGLRLGCTRRFIDRGCLLQQGLFPV